MFCAGASIQTLPRSSPSTSAVLSATHRRYCKDAFFLNCLSKTSSRFRMKGSVHPAGRELKSYRLKDNTFPTKTHLFLNTWSVHIAYEANKCMDTFGLLPVSISTFENCV